MIRIIFCFTIPLICWSQEPTTKYFGHRGCRGLMPENSIQSFQKAIDLGVDGIELDVVVNKDKQLVISHEPYFQSSFCLDPQGNSIKNEKQWNIYNLTQDEINQFDCGSKPHPRFKEQSKFKVNKPLLQDLFKQVDLSKTIILFEVKSSLGEYGVSQPFPEEYVRIILNEISNFSFKKNILFMSFDSNILEEIHKKIPDARCIYLTFLPFVKAKSFVHNLSFKPYALGMFYKTIHRKDARFLHEQGIRLFAWTVNKTRTQNRLKRIQVDGIITDFPDRIK
jgi:glycerophosphoryl diester phosphodiesterase